MKALVNALTIALAEQGLVGPEAAFASFKDAQLFAQAFFTENAELLAPAAPVPQPASAQGAIRPSRVVRGDLMPHQAVALEQGVGLCPNCQQPNTDHLPGCARIDYGLGAMDPKAVTKNPLPPAEA